MINGTTCASIPMDYWTDVPAHFIVNPLGLLVVFALAGRMGETCEQD